MMFFPFTLHLSPFTKHYPLTVNEWLIANGKYTENGKRLIVNASEGGFS